MPSVRSAIGGLLWSRTTRSGQNPRLQAINEQVTGSLRSGQVMHSAPNWRARGPCKVYGRVSPARGQAQKSQPMAVNCESALAWGESRLGHASSLGKASLA
jgi:hypothetical protein